MRTDISRPDPLVLAISAKASSVELTDEEKRIIDARLEKYHQNPELGSPWVEVYKRIASKQ